MSTESLNRTSVEIENPSHKIEAPQSFNVDVLKQRANLEALKQRVKVNSLKQKVNIVVLKQRLIEKKKKEKVKTTIIVSSVIASLGALTFLTY